MKRPDIEAMKDHIFVKVKNWSGQCIQDLIAYIEHLERMIERHEKSLGESYKVPDVSKRVEKLLDKAEKHENYNRSWRNVISLLAKAQGDRIEKLEAVAIFAEAIFTVTPKRPGSNGGLWDSFGKALKDAGYLDE